MADLKKLSHSEIAESISNLEGWSLSGGKLYKEFKFNDFREAFAFMTKTAEAAEAMNHHPEWFNVYNIVKVYLSTHDVDGISDRDLELAGKMENFAKS